VDDAEFGQPSDSVGDGRLWIVLSSALLLVVSPAAKLGAEAMVAAAE
jgi:hypothetical protein